MKSLIEELGTALAQEPVSMKANHLTRLENLGLTERFPQDEEHTLLFCGGSI